jgi:hypothetical protein
MSRSMWIGYGLVLSSLLVLGEGCADRPPRTKQPMIDAVAAGKKAVETYDTDKNGTISPEEMKKSPGLEAARDVLDPAGQGVKAPTITARIKIWQKNNVTRVPVTCTVLRNGKPLEGAEVKLVPESFLGPRLLTATGTTGRDGVTNLSVGVGPGLSEAPGVPPGFYRVEVTKPGLDLPAKYNSETALGVEVAYGTPAMTEGLQLNLEF